MSGYGNLQVTSNVCAAVTGSTNSNEFYDPGMAWADEDVVVNTSSIGTAPSGISPGVRMSATAGYIADWVLGNHTMSVYKLTGSGGYTQIDTFSDTYTNGDTLEISVSGSTLTMKRNGSTIHTTTDSTYTTGRPGLYIYSTGGTAVTKWTATQLP